MQSPFGCTLLEAEETLTTLGATPAALWLTTPCGKAARRRQTFTLAITDARTQ